VDWLFIGGIATGFAALAARYVYRRREQSSAADASGLEPSADLMHVSPALQRTALWLLAEGGFESRVVRGSFARDHGDVTVTAFDLETHRERRGEWAQLPVVPPFRIAGTVSAVVNEIERDLPHLLLKRAGRGDQLQEDNVADRLASMPKRVRFALRLGTHHASELPSTLTAEPIDAALPEGWRAYGSAALLASLLEHGFTDALDRASRRDLVVEMLENIIVVYPAAREVAGADALADLTTTALIIVDGVLASLPPTSPRGVEPS
jgi:hypothetical protein